MKSRASSIAHTTIEQPRGEYQREQQQDDKPFERHPYQIAHLHGGGIYRDIYYSHDNATVPKLDFRYGWNPDRSYP